MPKRIEFEGQIHEFPDDFTDADIAAALGGQAPKEPARASGSPITPGVMAGLGGVGVGAMKAAPAIVSKVNTVANITRGIPPLIGGRWPAVAEIVAHATGPVGGPVAVGANVVSKLASTLGVPLAVASSLYDAYQLQQTKPFTPNDPQNVVAGRPFE